ncbi:hypothetical protein [Streptomyces qinglanensis]|uniref:hypothetical protein n=1 Tax=Streptomyces qinglanensis TaxID=943816 RepID=UPI003D7073C9
MTPAEMVEALGEAELHAHLDRRDEAAADDGGRREAELTEWRRIVELLATTGGPYDPDADAVVQAELAEDQRRERAEQQRRQEQQQVPVRAGELAALAGARPWRAGRATKPPASSWTTAATTTPGRSTAGSRTPSPPTPAITPTRTPARPPPPCCPTRRARAVLLAALARTGTPVDGDLEFVGRLAQADPDATTALAAWLDKTAAVKGGTAWARRTRW